VDVLPIYFLKKNIVVNYHITYPAGFVDFNEFKKLKKINRKKVGTMSLLTPTIKETEVVIRWSTDR